MDAPAIERAAALLCRVRLERERLVGLPEDCRPKDEAEAYAVQDALHRKLGIAGYGDLAGHKIGCTTPVMQQFLGIGNPCAGGVFAPTVQQEPGSFRHADFLHVGVECEIAVRLARDLPASGAPPTTAMPWAMQWGRSWRRSRSWTTATTTTAAWTPRP
jgi:2-keto-4-pentenoate hydratase